MPVSLPCDPLVHKASSGDPRGRHADPDPSFVEDLEPDLLVDVGVVGGVTDLDEVPPQIRLRNARGHQPVDHIRDGVAAARHLLELLCEQEEVTHLGLVELPQPVDRDLEAVTVPRSLDLDPEVLVFHLLQDARRGVLVSDPKIVGNALWHGDLDFAVGDQEL